MKPVLKWFSLSAALCLMAGCATQRNEVVQSGTVATCYVCNYNNDLACVRIPIKDSTARANYREEIFYFCSEDCREAFLKNPEKYLPKEKSKP